MFETVLLKPGYLFDIITKHVYVSLIPMLVDDAWCRSKLTWSDVVSDAASDVGDS
jgi:hypothetical protein